PSTIDVVVATNLHADILSDLASALSGSLGLGPTGNINPNRDTPSMFEPIHGSAFDIQGQGVANPIATFWSASMMLEHLGETAAAGQLMTAVLSAVKTGPLPADLGGEATTADVTALVVERIRGRND
ncbi:MAG: isocitrate/isopropylmalate family dehydrogenase, partial [Geminicoccaceae bacterium]